MVQHGIRITTGRTATGILTFHLRYAEWDAMGTLLTYAKRPCPHALFPNQTTGRLTMTQAVDWGDSILHLVGIVYHDQQTNRATPHPRADAHRQWRLSMDYWAYLGQSLVSARVPLTYTDATWKR